VEEKTISQILKKLLVGVVGKKERGRWTKKGEGTSRSKLGGMGMMGKWMEARAQLGVK
jgi:hypothetical protein